jgi:hypothetical protein
MFPRGGRSRLSGIFCDWADPLVVGLVVLVLMESLILAQDERWRRA